MGKQVLWTSDQIEVDVRGVFTTHHYLDIEAGTLGEFTFPAFSQQGVFQTADGRELVMQKISWLSSAHEVVEGETVRGTADRRGLLKLEIDLQFDGRAYTLEPGGLLSRDWNLFDAEGNRLLEIQPRGLLKQGAYLTLKSVVDADLVAFAYYLVHMRWQEDAAAAAATSAAAS
jgi:hypothetical protein